MNPSKQNASKKSAPKGGKKSKKQSKAPVAPKGQRALGFAGTGPQQLKNEQFAAYTPLTTFAVTQGSTPGGIRVRGRELVQALPSGLTTLLFGANNTTSAAAVNILPGNFPRLSAYSSIYEFYKFHKAKIMFQSNQPTTAGGVSMIAVDYDAKDSAPTTSILMMRNISSSMSNIYADNACEVLGSLSRLPKYATSEATSSDNNQVIQAIAWYAFEGVTGVNAAQGYLVVEYDVEFFTPQ
jgi:hypothetical protein